MPLVIERRGRTMATMRNALLGSLVLSAAATLPVSAQMGPYRGPTEIDTTGNRVLEPGETASVVPSWGNSGFINLCSANGRLGSFTGPAGPTYTIVDGVGDYGCLWAQSPPVPCGDCYAVRIDAAIRPVPHWDALAMEGAVGIQDPLPLHVGLTFADVPAASPFYRFIETIVHKDVTGGCTADAYCPAAPTSREAMAVFLLVAKEPRGYAPPPCGATPVFPDVPVTSPFCPWIEELARRGVTAGCGTGYCPEAAVSREQMAVFILRTLDPSLNPPACGTPAFADVPAASPFCPWIEELARRGVVTGCGGGNYCPASDVTREQMSVFLTVTFGLLLYGL